MEGNRAVRNFKDVFVRETVDPRRRDKCRVPLAFRSGRPEGAAAAVCTPLQSGVALRLPPHSKKKLSQYSTVQAGPNFAKASNLR
jgi:hypothetical protein